MASLEKAREEFLQFEKRAVLAEKQIKELTERVVKLEASAEGPTSHADGEYQKNLLGKLRNLRDVAEDDKNLLEQTVKERDEAIKERDALKEDKKHLEYRIQTLLRTLAEAEAKDKQV